MLDTCNEAFLLEKNTILIAIKTIKTINRYKKFGFKNSIYNYSNNFALDSECAKWNKVSSLKESPITWKPIGRPSFVVPPGTFSDGEPMRLQGTVNLSDKYIFIGSSNLLLR